MSVRTPKETETRQLRYDMARTAPDGTVQRDAYQIPLTYDQLWASPTKKVTQGSFSFLTRWRQGEKLIDLTAAWPRCPGGRAGRLAGRGER